MTNVSSSNNPFSAGTRKAAVFELDVYRIRFERPLEWLFAAAAMIGLTEPVIRAWRSSDKWQAALLAHPNRTGRPGRLNYRGQPRTRECCPNPRCGEHLVPGHVCHWTTQS
jgi:hypothetical protein